MKGGVMGEIRERGGRKNYSWDIIHERIKIIKTI